MDEASIRYLQLKLSWLHMHTYPSQYSYTTQIIVVNNSDKCITISQLNDMKPDKITAMNYFICNSVCLQAARNYKYSLFCTAVQLLLCEHSSWSEWICVSHCIFWIMTMAVWQLTWVVKIVSQFLCSSVTSQQCTSQILWI